MAGKKPYFAVILIQAIYAGLILLSKAAFNSGMKSYIFIFYRQLAGTAILCPLAFFFERKTAPPISMSILGKLFILSFIGCVSCYYIHIRRLAQDGNSEGLYQDNGPEHEVDVNSTEMWIKGCFLAFLSIIFWGLWLVLQAQVMRCYPAKLTFTTLQCLLSTFQSFAVAIIWNRNFEEWKLGFNVRLLAISYSGILVTAVTFYVQAWVIEKKGPVFQAMSTPLSLVMTIFCSAFFLGEVTSLGSILGSILLVASLYSVLWGKSKEQNAIQSSLLKQNDSQETSNV